MTQAQLQYPRQTSPSKLGRTRGVGQTNTCDALWDHRIESGRRRRMLCLDEEPLAKVLRKAPTGDRFERKPPPHACQSGILGAMTEHPDTSPSPRSNDHADFPGAELLRTRRMRLSGLRYADVMDLYRLGRDPRVTFALIDAPVDSVMAAAAMIEQANRIYARRPGLGLWRAEDGMGRFLGFFSLVAELDPAIVEIGVRLLPSAWGRGYALEGGEALCAHAFDTLSLNALYALCAPDNRSVPPLLERLGFEHAGRTEQFGRVALRFTLWRHNWRGITRRKRSKHV